MCLFGARTAGDQWVRWMLSAAGDLELPIVGVPLVGELSLADLDLLAVHDAEVAPLNGEVIVHRLFAARLQEKPYLRSLENPLLLALRLMRPPH